MVCHTSLVRYVNYQSLDSIEHTLRVFKIHCEEQCHALFIADCNNCVRVWVNGVLRGMFEGNQRMLILSMDHGDNIIGLEIAETTSNTYMFLRVSCYETELDTFPNPVLNNLSFVGNLGYLKHYGQHLYNGEPFRFLFFPNNDLISMNSDISVRLYCSFEKETLFSAQLSVCQEHTIDLTEYSVYEYAAGNTLAAEFQYKYSDGTLYYSTVPLYTNNVEIRLNEICNRASRVLNRNTLTDYDRLAVTFGLEYISKYGRALAPILAQASLLRGTLNRIDDIGRADDNFFAPGERRVFFYNELYNAVNYYRILVPDDYTPTYKYPLLVIFSTIEYGAWCRNFKRYTKEPLVVVDVSGRGVILGSYMGDASIQIALSDIFEKYSIDRTRVYCTGNSNGAGTAWAQVEAHPDVYAGIYAVSGQPNYDLLMNLDNQKIITLSSNADFMYPIFQKTKEKLICHNDFTAFEPIGYSHQALHLLWFNERIFEKLLSARLDFYPQKIRFRTFSNRHRKSYWLELHSLAAGALEATIEAEIHDCTIELQGEGMTGFSVCIPPQLKGKNIYVRWNKKPLCHVENANGTLYFAQSNQHLRGESDIPFVLNNSYVQSGKTYQGYGLLDVYLDPLTVVVPDHSNKEVLDVAKIFSEPVCNGFIPKIYVSYPICSFNEMNIDNEVKYYRSMIVIDDFSSDNSFVLKLRENAPIKVTKTGWSYGIEEHNENYCIQQIFENPWNTTRSVVLVSTNNCDYFHKNFFTRKMIIPTYANGHHKYLNADAIIFNGKYFGVFDWRTKTITEL